MMKPKKLLSLLACLCLLATVCVPVGASDFSKGEIGCFEDGSYVVYAPAKATLYLAGYQNGKMLYIVPVPESSSSASYDVARKFTVPESSADTLKLFLIGPDFTPLGMIVTTPDKLPAKQTPHTPGIII